MRSPPMRLELTTASTLPSGFDMLGRGNDAIFRGSGREYLSREIRAAFTPTAG